MVKEESAQMLIAAFESASLAVGAKDPYALFTRVTDWWEKRKHLVLAMRTRKEFAAFICNWPDETEAYVPAIAALMMMAPTIIANDLTKMIWEAAQEHPVVNPAGRPKVMDDTLAQKICDEIIDLFRVGVAVSVAQERVATRHSISIRSVQRAWRKRDKLEPPRPQSINDIFEAIQKLGE